MCFEYAFLVPGFSFLVESPIAKGSSTRNETRERGMAFLPALRILITDYFPLASDSVLTVAPTLVPDGIVTRAYFSTALRAKRGKRMITLIVASRLIVSNAIWPAPPERCPEATASRLALPVLPSWQKSNTPGILPTTEAKRY